MDIEYYILNPAGNITALVVTPVPAEKRPAIGAGIMANDKFVEQVGFIIEEESGKTTLQMAGGEFCGNAARCAAVLKCFAERMPPDEKKTVSVKVSGIGERLAAEVTGKESGEFYCSIQMPRPDSVSEKQYELNGKTFTLPTVTFGKMTHIICEGQIKREEAEKAAKKWCNEANCDCLGIMLLSADNTTLTPLVYVPAAGTMFWENSCASGSAAAGAYLAEKGRRGAFSFKEPGGTIEITIGSSKQITLSGPVAITERHLTSADGYDEYKDIPYGPHARHKADIVFPKGAKGEVDLVLYIHGGGWIAGRKDQYFDDIANCARKKYAAAAINYRFIDKTVSGLDILDDITAALEKIKQFAAEKGITIKKALLTGLSAGAHLSLLYAYKMFDESPVTPAAVFSLSGPTDIFSTDSEKYLLTEDGKDITVDIFSSLSGAPLTKGNYYSPESEAKLKAVSPLCFVNENTVPTVICHGLKDDIVPYENAVSLDRALNRNGITREFITFPHSGHLLDSDPDCTERMNTVFLDYLKRYLRPFKS